MTQPISIMPCLDMRNGRVVKGVHFVASGGAGNLEHFYEAVEAGVTIRLGASVFHFHMIDIPNLKNYLRSRGVDLQ